MLPIICRNSAHHKRGRDAAHHAMVSMFPGENGFCEHAEGKAGEDDVLMWEYCRRMFSDGVLP